MTRPASDGGRGMRRAADFGGASRASVVSALRAQGDARFVTGLPAADGIRGPGFAWFIERPRARIESPLDSDDAKRAKMRWEETQGRIQDTPVGLLSPAAAQATGMPRVARLNERVAHKEEIHHPELTIAFWQAVPGVLARETPAPAGDRRWRFEGRRVVDGRELLVRVVVEADKDTGYAVGVSGHYTTKKKRPAG